MPIPFFPRPAKKKIEMLICVRDVGIIITRRRIKMFNNPEFYLLFQQEPNGVIMPAIDNICLFVIHSLVGFGGVMALYKLLFYAGGISKYFWTALWNSLTPGNQWLDLAIIGTTIICGVVMVLAIKGMAEVLESGFIKLKNEIKKKDERIRELEAKLEDLELKKKKEIKIEKGEDDDLEPLILPASARAAKYGYGMEVH